MKLSLPTIDHIRVLGHSAFLCGCTLADNPYHSHEPEYRAAWAEGWKDEQRHHMESVTSHRIARG